MIEMDQLEDGAYYRGLCPGKRGPHVMAWDQARGMFVYIRYKFGTMLVDQMNHEHDPKRGRYIEGFVPLELIREPTNEEWKEHGI